MFRKYIFIFGLLASFTSFAAPECKSLFQTCISSCSSRATCQKMSPVCSIFGFTEKKDQGALKCESLWAKDVEPSDLCAGSVYAAQKQGFCTGHAF